MVIMEKKDLLKELENVRKFYDKLKEKYNQCLSLFEESEQTDEEVSIKDVIKEISENLKTAISLNNQFKGVGIAKKSGSNIRLQFKNKEKEFSEAANNFYDYWNDENTSDKQRTDYAIKLGEIAKEFKSVTVEMKRFDDTISFLENEIKEGRIKELDSMIDYFEQTQKTLSIIIRQENAAVRENVELEPVTENEAKDNAEDNTEEKEEPKKELSTFDDVMRRLDEITAVNDNTSTEADDSNNKKKGFFSKRSQKK